MTIIDDATFPETGSVRFERILNAPVERVWDYLTVPDLRQTWLGGGSIELVPGGHATLLYDNANLTDEPMPADDDAFEPHVEESTVIAVDPPHLLSYTWGEWFGQNCVVSYELEPVGDKTRLVLTHSRVASVELSLDVARGWHVQLDVLAARIDGTPLPHLWDRFDEVGKHYATLIDAGSPAS
jgi:uncharacterized protein YndB with AHSA1/START domain